MPLMLTTPSLKASTTDLEIPRPPFCTPTTRLRTYLTLYLGISQASQTYHVPKGTLRHPLQVSFLGSLSHLSERHYYPLNFPCQKFGSYPQFLPSFPHTNITKYSQLYLKECFSNPSGSLHTPGTRGTTFLLDCHGCL